MSDTKQFHTVEDCVKHLEEGQKNGWPDHLPGEMARDLISTVHAVNAVNEELRSLLNTFGISAPPSADQLSLDFEVTPRTPQPVIIPPVYVSGKNPYVVKP